MVPARHQLPLTRTLSLFEQHSELYRPRRPIDVRVVYGDELCGEIENTDIDERKANCYTTGIKKGIKMESIKTAISIDKSLFAQANALARKMKVSRSRLFVIALEDFIRQQENREILEKINAVYADEPDEAEKELRRKMRQSFGRLVEGQW